MTPGRFDYRADAPDKSRSALTRRLQSEPHQEDSESPYFVGSLTSGSQLTTTWLGHVDELAIMAEHLYQNARALGWTREDRKPDRDDWPPSVAVRNTYTNSVAIRPEGPWRYNLRNVINDLEAEAVMILQNNTTADFLERTAPMSQSVTLTNNKIIDVYESIEDISELSALDSSGFCLVRDLQAALVWTRNVKSFIRECHTCEQALSMTLWRNNHSNFNSWAFQDYKLPSGKREQTTVEVHEVEEESAFGVHCLQHTHRPTRLIWPVSVAITFILMGLIIGSLLSDLVLAVVRDGTFVQLLFILYLPLTGFLSSVSGLKYGTNGHTNLLSSSYPLSLLESCN